MELNELHVLQRDTCAVGHGEAIRSGGVGIRGERVQSTRPAGSNDSRLSLECVEVATSEFNGCDSMESFFVNEQTGHEPFMVKFDVRVAEAGVVEGLHLIEAHPITGEGRPWVAVSSERALCNASLTVAAPRHSQMF